MIFFFSLGFLCVCILTHAYAYVDAVLFFHSDSTSVD